MSRSLLIGGLALGGGALIALAIRGREPLGRAAVVVHTAAQKGARKVVATVKEMTGGISQEKLDMIARYNIGALADAYKGSLSWGLVMSMIEHETGKKYPFNPFVYNYYKLDDKGKKTKKYGQALASPNAPLVTVWKQKGDGGFEFDPHAVGLLQILDNIRIDSKNKGKFNYAGFPLPYLNDLVDPEKNIKAALMGANSNAKKLRAAVPGLSGLFLDQLIYWSHANGPYTLIDGGKQQGAFSKLKAAGKVINWANLVALPWNLENKISGVAYVAGRAAVWEKKKGQVVQMGPPEPRVGAETSSEMVKTITQATIDVLIAEMREAEAKNDFDTMGELQAQVVALQGSVA